jgi:hypothetical protein
VGRSAQGQAKRKEIELKCKEVKARRTDWRKNTLHPFFLSGQFFTLNMEGCWFL